MLLDLSDLFKRYAIDPHGVVHIGAHKGEERDAYLRCRFGKIIWIEANSQLAADLAATINADIQNDVREIVIQALVTEKDGDCIDFHIANNGQSSSIFDFGTHRESYPEILIESVVSLPTKCVETILSEMPFETHDIAFANLDIQGAELLALKGFGDTLPQFSWIYTEINMAYVYRDNPLVWDLDRFLLDMGFVRKETILTSEGWGDALYVRRENLSKTDLLRCRRKILREELVWRCLIGPVKRFSKRVLGLGRAVRRRVNFVK